MSHDRRMDDLLEDLQERAKELRCLYRVMDALGKVDAPLDEVFARVLRAIPDGFQYPGVCRPLLRVGDRMYRLPDFHASPWMQRSEIRMDDEAVGELCVYYAEGRPQADEGPFLKQERHLLDTLADRIGLFLLQRARAGERPREAGGVVAGGERGDWRVVLDFLKRTDPQALRRITVKMLNLLRWRGVVEVERIFQAEAEDLGSRDENRAGPRQPGRPLLPPEQVFAIAEANCTTQEILGYIQMWLVHDKVGFLVSTVAEQGSSLTDITEALALFQVLGMEESELPTSVQTTVRVALLRRFFTDQLAFINIAKGLTTIADFQELVKHVLHPPRSYGKLGGKSTGLFLARKIVEASAEYESVLRDIKVPRTWYLTSDSVMAFIRFNNLDDVHDRKYLDVEQVRQQYPHVVQVFKSATFPPELVKGLSTVLDDMGADPLIVRSSSLLEDRTGAVFSGKYKSLFLGNQGTKQERLRALQDAIAEVYASMFGPDPIGYRAERNLLDVHEEMGIMIQAVVGTRVGRYYLPAFSGVAFTHNEFRWSPRIRREDGLVRLVAGLGTRAVDRLSDDYPVLLAPGQPGLRVNASLDEVVRYSPKMVDLINLQTNQFETIPISQLLRECGDQLPLVRRMVSLIDGDRLRRPRGLTDDVSAGNAVVTFEGLASETTFVPCMATLLKVLQDRLGTPVDVEFASDGTHLYLLQCRPQSYGGLDAPPAIPREVPLERLVFSAHRFVSNGRADAITHIVYVDPDQYALLESLEELREVGRVVGRLNKVLPKHHFILIGPGRWGSRGDIRLGVSVGYADINNTAVLVEMARKKGNYVPDLSFGTHFFQDLVEARIRYLPLYPDEPGNHFDEAFLLGAPNLLPGLLPDSEHLSHVVRVIDVPKTRDGLVLNVLMNGETEEAVGILCEPGGPDPDVLFPPVAPPREVPGAALRPAGAEDQWRWRLAMAERIAAQVDAERFGVRGMWVYGSTRNATAGPDSDLDLLVHFTGDERQRRELLAWLEGWGRALTEAHFFRSGRRVEMLLDAELVSDEDIAGRRGVAAKIHAVTDAARPLSIGEDW
ncbi:MAG: PEP/pyruvate-binding domain-containing protein [Longimicrobiales bacterium]|nr:PEP/pyruvate-binding domain-containing protein [Longimicrobiales bacterium]